MKKRNPVKMLTIVAASVLILCIVGLRLVDVIAKSVLDSQVSAILGVEARVSGVSLGVLTSSSSFTGITIENPPGFKEEYVLSIESATMDVGIGTLLSNDIEIPNIVLTGLTFDLEEVDKKINIEEVVNNITAYSDAQPATDTPTEVEIKTLHVHDLDLKASGSIVTITGGHLETKVPDFTVKNIGTKSNPSKMSEQFVNVLMHAVLSHVFDHPIEGLSSVFTSSVKKAVYELPKNFIEGGIKDIGNVLDSIKDGLLPGKPKPDSP
ncbi:MAG: AsmA family protein [Phycisphaerales bacterium]|nr:AsmA family protein [Phycisphaerales bacterium]